MIELKARFGIEADIDQLAGCIYRAHDKFADGERVFGVLIADGFDETVADRLRELDVKIFVQMLTACRYHDHRYAQMLAAERI